MITGNKKLLPILLIFFLIPQFAKADYISGGIYRVHNSQLNPVGGIYSGGGLYNTQVGSAPISGVSSGGDYIVQQGTPYNFENVTDQSFFGQTSSPSISGIQTVELTCNKATIIFLTNTPAYYSFSYFANGQVYSVPFSENLDTTHAITLSSLSPNTEYFYSIYVKDEIGRVGDESNIYFVTPSCEVATDNPSTQNNTNVTEEGSGSAVYFDESEKTELFFSIDVNVLPSYKNINKGESLVARIVLTDLTNNKKRDNVNVIYKVINKDTREIVASFEEVKNLGLKSVYIKEFNFPKVIAEGDYDIVGIIEYDRGFAQASDDFSVIEKKLFCSLNEHFMPWWWIFALLILLIDYISKNNNKNSTKLTHFDLKNHIKKGKME